MPRYLVTINVAPVRFDGEPRAIMCIRSVTAASPEEAVAQTLLAVRRELQSELGQENVRDATYSLSSIGQRLWYQRRKLTTNIVHLYEPSE